MRFDQEKRFEVSGEYAEVLEVMSYLTGLDDYWEFDFKFGDGAYGHHVDLTFKLNDELETAYHLKYGEDMERQRVEFERLREKTRAENMVAAGNMNVHITDSLTIRSVAARDGLEDVIYRVSPTGILTINNEKDQ